MAAVDRKFKALDPDDTGYLVLSQLPKTPAQLDAAKAAQKR